MLYTKKIGLAPILTVSVSDVSADHSILKLLGNDISFPKLCEDTGWTARSPGGGSFNHTFNRKQCVRLCSIEDMSSMFAPHPLENEFWRNEQLYDCEPHIDLRRVKSVFELTMITHRKKIYFGPSLMAPAFFHNGFTSPNTSRGKPEPYYANLEAGMRVGLGAVIELDSFIPIILESGLTFNYTASLQYPPPRYGPLPINIGIAQALSNYDAATLVLDSSNNKYKLIPPSDGIHLKLSEILLLTRLGSYAAVIDPAEYAKRFRTFQHAVSMGKGKGKGRANFLEVPSSLYAKGATISSQVNCYNTNDDLAEIARAKGVEPWDVQAFWSRPVCVMEFVYITDELEVYGQTGQIGKALHENGISILCRPGNSYYRVIDVANCLVNIASMLVLIGIPNIIIRFIILNGLGQLSVIYKRAVIQPFDVRSQCGIVAARLVTQSVPFAELSDVVDGDGRSCISLERMTERLASTLEHRGLTEVEGFELENLSKFCYQEIINPRRSYTHVCNVCLGQRSMASSAREMIDIDNFSCALHKDDAMEIDSIIRLFDCDRRVLPAERFFTPKDIQRFARDHKRKSRAARQSRIASAVIRHNAERLSLHDDTGESPKLIGRIEDCKDQHEDIFECKHSEAQHAEGMHKSVLDVQARQAHMESEMELLQSQVRNLLADGNQVIDPKRPPGNITKAMESDAIEALRREIRAMKHTFDESVQSNNGTLEQSVSGMLQPLKERITSIENRLEIEMKDFALADNDQDNSARRLELIETRCKILCSEQFHLLENRFYEHLKLLQDNLHVGLVPQPIARSKNGQGDLQSDTKLMSSPNSNERFNAGAFFDSNVERERSGSPSLISVLRKAKAVSPPASSSERNRGNGQGERIPLPPPTYENAFNAKAPAISSAKKDMSFERGRAGASAFPPRKTENDVQAEIIPNTELLSPCNTIKDTSLGLPSLSATLRAGKAVPRPVSFSVKDREHVQVKTKLPTTPDSESTPIRCSTVRC